MSCFPLILTLDYSGQCAYAHTCVCAVSYTHLDVYKRQGLAIEGPSEAKMTCKDNRDGSCSVEYIPTEPGEYDVSIKFSDHHIPGSPFKVIFCFLCA